MKRWQLLISGEGRDSKSGRTFERKSPATGEVVGVYAEADEQDVDDAVAVARKTFDDGKWSAGPAKVRAAVLHKAAELLRARADELARLISTEMGKPVAHAKGEALSAAEVFDYYAGLALDLHGQVYTQQVPDSIGMVLREPVGVVAMITPWNFPLALLTWKLGPALAAGCTVVSKPSHLTSGVALELGRLLLDAGLPAGVLSILTGAAENGAIVGGALVNHRGVDKVAFTGSTATGRKIAEAAGRSLKRVSLELGGKSPNIVFADAASLDVAANGAYQAIYFNAGQVCNAGSRLLVQESIKDAFLEKLVAVTQKKLKLGDPLDAGTTMGPIVSEPQLQRVMSYVDAGKASARLVTGGARALDGALAKGLYVQPTIFDGVTSDQTIAREEIFGPVLSVIPFKDAEDALRLAHETMYGLAAAVWTRDVSTALRFAKSLRAGTVWVNAFHGTGFNAQMPFGGFKDSGLGRELGHEGMAAYLEVKSVQVKL
jgi:acyl-CoA reductase-like NAD-dependent aldehyde dehydrogenase